MEAATSALRVKSIATRMFHQSFENGCLLFFSDPVLRE